MPEPVPMNEPSDTGGGFITGADPRQQPMTAAQWAEANGNIQPSGSTTVNSGLIGGSGWQPQVPQGVPGQRYYTEAEVGEIRTEEKAKLYDRLSAMETELATVRTERETREAALAAERAEAEAELQAKLDAEKDLRTLLNEKEQAWTQRFESLEGERARERALLDQERRFNEVQEYRRNRIEQESHEIFPELRDMIQGASEEEIDQSIEAIKLRCRQIDENYRVGIQAQRASVRGTMVTAPPVGPMEQQTSYETLTDRDIANMDPATYARNRPAIMEALKQRRMQGR